MSVPRCGSIIVDLALKFSSNTKEQDVILSATPAKSGPLDFPSVKSFLLFFAHENCLGHMFQKSFSRSPILSFCVAISQK